MRRECKHGVARVGGIGLATARRWCDAATPWGADDRNAFCENRLGLGQLSLRVAGIMMRVVFRVVRSPGSEEVFVRVLILLTNDDGIYAPGLAAMERQLRRLGDVYVVAPATEQSGVGHSITYLTPLIVKEVFHGPRRWGWAVEGSPADCVKIAVTKLCPQRPDLVVSGINGGLNVGINVLYSGTVAAAIEGAFFGITSVAVSLEFSEQAPFDKAARLARGIIEQVLRQKAAGPQLYNLNIPTAALLGTPEVRTVSMNVTHYDDEYERRSDPWGRDYYWATGRPPVAPGEENDLATIGQGHVALTPLGYNLTARAELERMQSWRFGLEDLENEKELSASDEEGCLPTVRAMRKGQKLC
jgi:5'-nucleotidase